MAEYKGGLAACVRLCQAGVEPFELLGRNIRLNALIRLGAEDYEAVAVDNLRIIGLVELLARKQAGKEFEFRAAPVIAVLGCEYLVIAHCLKDIAGVAKQLELHEKEAVLDELTVHGVVPEQHQSVVPVLSAADIHKYLRELLKSVVIVALHMDVRDNGEREVGILIKRLVGGRINIEYRRDNKGHYE